MGNSQLEKATSVAVLSYAALYGIQNAKSHDKINEDERKSQSERRVKEEVTRYSCPICELKFPMGEFNEAHEHYERCVISNFSNNENQINPNPVNAPPSLNSRIFNNLEELRTKLENIKIPWSEGYVKFNILRQELLNDSVNQLSGLNNRHLRSEFQVEFVNEKGQDAGGLTKEWMNLIVKELLTNDLKLFKATNTEERRYRIANNHHSPSYYMILGRVIGKAILSSIPINCPLSITILKQILDHEISREDVRHVDFELYKGMKAMESNSIEGIFFETFSISINDQIFELLHNGQNIQVTDENKSDYIDLRIAFELYTSIESGILELKRGIFDVIPREFFEGVSCEELDLLICGNPVIDLGEWKRFTEYKGEFNERHNVIKWFWEYMGKLDQENLKQFLYFVTGAYKVPIEGFEKLKTQRGDPAKFSIQSFNYFHGALPRAHTCFNRLDLPLYLSKQELEKALGHILLNYNQEFHLD